MSPRWLRGPRDRRRSQLSIKTAEGSRHSNICHFGDFLILARFNVTRSDWESLSMFTWFRVFRRFLLIILISVSIVKGYWQIYIVGTVDLYLLWDIWRFCKSSEKAHRQMWDLDFWDYLDLEKIDDINEWSDWICSRGKFRVTRWFLQLVSENANCKEMVMSFVLIDIWRNSFRKSFKTP